MFSLRPAALETVAAARREARRRLPGPVWSLLGGGTQGNVTADANEAIYSQVGLRSRLCHAAPAPELSTRLLGNDLALPMIAAPMAARGLSAASEHGIVRACHAAGTLAMVSHFSAVRWEELMPDGRIVPQFYLLDERARLADRLDELHDRGIQTIAVTLDWTFPRGRDRGTPTLPDGFGRELLRWLPGALAHPGWTLSQFAGGSPFPQRVPNAAPAGEAAPTFGEVMRRWQRLDPPTWDDVAWFRDRWPGDLVVKGVLDPRDAAHAMDAGADALVVSNHGGNDLDTTPPTLAAIGAVRERVGDTAVLIADGGVRRGSDAAKLIALGADAVGVGRAIAWGLAARGQRGVQDVLALLRRDLSQTLQALGVGSLGGLGPEHLILDRRFTELRDHLTTNDEKELLP